MKPRSIKRINKQDFPPEVQAWIDILLYPLNASVEQTNIILSKNISLSDNIAAEVRVLRIEGCSEITASTTSGSNTLINASYYQSTIDGVNYGAQVGQAIWGLGIPPGTLITSVSGSSITMSQACTITQTNAGLLCGGFFPLRIAFTIDFRPSSVFISSVTDINGNPTYISSGVTPQWRLDGNEVVIDGISGLQAGRSYNITFVLL